MVVDIGEELSKMEFTQVIKNERRIEFLLL